MESAVASASRVVEARSFLHYALPGLLGLCCVVSPSSLASRLYAHMTSGRRRPARLALNPVVSVMRCKTSTARTGYEVVVQLRAVTQRMIHEPTAVAVSLLAAFNLRGAEDQKKGLLLVLRSR